jgi:hypothetical protein
MAGYHAAVASVLAGAEPPSASPAARDEVVRFVTGRIAAMPLHLGLGLDAVAALLAASTAGRPPDLARLERWASSPIGPVRQYVRAVRSLVLFAAYELSVPDEAVA